MRRAPGSALHYRGGRGFLAGIRAAAENENTPLEMMRDRDPDTGKRFPTIMALREKKLRDWAAGAARLPFTHHITCRDFLLDPA